MGAKTWPCYNQNRVITSCVIKGLKCNTMKLSSVLLKDVLLIWILLHVYQQERTFSPKFLIMTRKFYYWDYLTVSQYFGLAIIDENVLLSGAILVFIKQFRKISSLSSFSTIKAREHSHQK